MVPNGWFSSKLGDVCQIINGRPFKPHEWRESGLPIIRIQNLNGSTEYNYYDGEFSDKVLIKSGQLLFAWSGSKGTSFGPHIWNGPDGLLNYHTWRMNVKDDVDSEFFFQYLRVITTRIEGKAHGASALVHTQKGEMEKFPIVIPPLPEQRKIAQILSTWDKAISTTEKLIESSKQQKKALMQQLLTGKKRLVNPKTGKVFEGEWEEILQGDVAIFHNGRAYKKTEWEEQGTPVIRLQNLTGRGTEYYYSRLELPEHQYCTKGDLLYMWSATFGPAIWKGDKAIYHYHIWKVSCKPNHLSKLFMFYMLDFETQKWMSQSNGMGLLHITKTTMEKQPIGLPSIAEQQKIASVLTAADKEIEVLEAKLAHFKQEKKALMQQLLTGKRRVKVIEVA